MILVISAISLGLLGSLHCVGMCGPIALALPVGNKSSFLKFISILIYNSGRVITYSLIGLLFGLIGKGFSIFNLQQVLSVSLGVFILAGILFPKIFPSLSPDRFAFFRKLKDSLSKLFHKRTMGSFFTIGILNGFLPCGLVYMAVAAAIATGSPFEGALFMALFGVGTIPAMLAISWVANSISKKFRTVVNKSMPVVVSLMAMLLIVRGLNLGIPYVSPKYENTSKEISCCEKNSNCEKDAEDQSESVSDELPSCCKKK
jgi:uncharacterized protein